MTANAKKSELLAWGKENLKGVENQLFPSFTPDMSDIDEDGIRWDIQQTIKHGFNAMGGFGMNMSQEENQRFYRIMAEEAKGKLHLVTAALGMPPAQTIEYLTFMKKMGWELCMFGFPSHMYFKTVDEAWQYAKAIFDKSPMPINLYITHKFNFERFHPGRFPLDLLERMAEHENVVTLKLAMYDPVFIFQACERVADKVLVGQPWFQWLPMLHRHYGQQWIGMGTYEVFQTPEKRYLVDFINLILKGEYEKASEIYWKLTPVVKMYEKQFIPTIEPGVYNGIMLKYFQWVTGGNGGWIRGDQHHYYEYQKEETKAAVRAIGITPREPDEEFYIGRLNYEKMKKGKIKVSNLR